MQVLFNCINLDKYIGNELLSLGVKSLFPLFVFLSNNKNVNLVNCSKFVDKSLTSCNVILGLASPKI
jgi:hypothetical protein